MYGVSAAQMQELHSKRDMLPIASASCESAVAQKNLLTTAKAAYDAAAGHWSMIPQATQTGVWPLPRIGRNPNYSG